MNDVTVIDNILPNFNTVLRTINEIEFQDAFSQGRIYADVTLDLSSDHLYEQVEKHLGFKPVNVLNFTRAYRERSDYLRPTWIHADTLFADYIGVLFIQSTKFPMDDAFCLWKHKELDSIDLKKSDFDGEREYKADLSTLTPEDWEIWKRVEFQPNRLVICPASYFHSTATYRSHGRTMNDCRIVQVIFFNKGPDNA